MPSLDTNCLLRWLLDDVPGQAARVDDLLGRHPRFHISDVALIEVVFVLDRVMRLSRPSVAAAVGALEADARFSFDRSLWREVLDGYLAHPKLSVADVYLAVEADRRDAVPLVTLDRKLATQLDGVELA